MEHHWGYRRPRESVISGGGQFRLVESQIFRTTFCILPSRLGGYRVTTKAHSFSLSLPVQNKCACKSPSSKGTGTPGTSGFAATPNCCAPNCRLQTSPTQGWIRWPPVTTEPNKICMLRPPALSHLGQRCKIPRPPLPGLFVFEVLPLLRIERRLGRVREI